MSGPYDGTYQQPSRATPAFVRITPLQVVLAAASGLALWLGWLGWDHEASWDAIAGVEQYPYTTLQVAGCALSVAVVTAVLAAWRQPLGSALGVTVGFVLGWSVDAARSDDTGLWLAGAIFLTLGMIVGTSIFAALGWGARQGVRALMHRRNRPPVDAR